MAKKRTREEKVIARLRKQAMENKPVEIARPDVRPSFYQPEIVLPVRAMRQDLTKTAIVTILAMIMQIGLFTYLNKTGGWNKVLNVLYKTTERR